MSGNQARGFVRDSRFGSGQVIKGANRATVRKWRALGMPEVKAELVKPGTCEACGAVRCACSSCTALMGGKCPECAGIPEVKRA